MPSAGDTPGRRKGVPASSSGDIGHHPCCVCAKPLCAPVQPFGQILMASRHLEMVNIGVCNLAFFFFFPVLCLAPLSWKQTQDEAKHLDLNPQTKPWPSSYSSSHRKLEYCPWNEQRICFWIVTFAAGGSLI